MNHMNNEPMRSSEKNLKNTRLSVLDLVSYTEGRSLSNAFQLSRQLAQHTETLGFYRYWMAEHHNLVGIASAATSVLIGYIAGSTEKIRVGSGGIMLPNHAPLVIAEQFGTLESLYPGRIDLGLGRAPGTDGLTMRALRRDLTNREDDFSEMIEELLYFFAPADAGQKLKAIPGAGIEIPIWILGSSLYSADLAAKLGRPYSFAGHFAPQLMIEAIDLYRSRFKPSAVLKKPHVMVGLPVIAAETDQRAEYLATSIYQRFLGMVKGDRKQTQPPVENMSALWSAPQESAVKSMLEFLVVGGPERIRAGLQKVIDQTGADEMILFSEFYDPKDRLKSYEVVAKAAELERACQAEKLRLTQF